MRRAFGAGTLVLIGDPKQAIYAFRGADVYAYLDAARSAGAHATLQVNWRSDQGLIDAYDALFDGAQLGHEGIVYRRVRAADANRAPRLTGRRARRCACASSTATSRRSSARPSGFARNASAREHIARDLAADVVRLLDVGRGDRDAAPTTAPWRAARRSRPATSPCSCARTATRRAVRDALDAAGIPAVINGAGSVFGTEAARDWLRLLEALERPASRPARARRRAHAVPRLERRSGSRAREEPEWEEVHRRLHAWARVLRLRGVAALTETVTLAEGLPARVLARPDGERELTDLRHVAQLLHAAATTEQLGTTALGAWLRRRIAEAADDTGDEERSRRLESDAEAVQVLTIHRSKGLEFPIVYFPYLWEPGYIPRSRARRLPRPRRRRPAHDRRRPGGRDVRAPQGAGAGRAARRGPAARLRRADPRAAPGGRLVGGLVRQPQLGARAAAVRARRGRHDRRDRGRARRPTARSSRASRRSPPARRAASPSSAPCRASRWPGRAAARPGRADRVALRPRARPALAPHVLQRHHRRGARGAGGERARGGRHRRRAGARDPAAGRPRRRRGAARGPVAARRDAGRACTSARSCTACSRRPTSPRPT